MDGYFFIKHMKNPQKPVKLWLFYLPCDCATDSTKKMFYNVLSLKDMLRRKKSFVVSYTLY